MAKIIIPKTEYITIKTHGHLLGKRARFKDNLKGYCACLWLRAGVIIQHEGVEHIGLSILFDDRKENSAPGELNSCYIMPDSYEVLE